MVPKGGLINMANIIEKMAQLLKMLMEINVGTNMTIFIEKIITKQWWVNGLQLEVNSQEEFERMTKLKAFW